MAKIGDATITSIRTNLTVSFYEIDFEMSYNPKTEPDYKNVEITIETSNNTINTTGDRLRELCDKILSGMGRLIDTYEEEK